MNVRLGAWSQVLAPGYGWCYRCGTPWRFVRGHSTTYHVVMYDDPPPLVDDAGLVRGRMLGCERAAFPLCEACWAEVGDPSSRLPYYRRLWELWVTLAAARGPHPGELAELDQDWAAIRDAVLAGG